MNAFDRLFHSPYGASRAYLFSKVFLLLLALDTSLLMIGHAGRYGIAGFNVAHFAWLDALQPIPSAASYIAVLVWTGLLALWIALTGLSTPSLALLFLLYTFSWSMSMLDSYQHHYLMSLMLLCLVFFPQTSAREIHPQPLDPPASERQKRKQKHARARAAFTETAGFLYAGSVLLAFFIYVLVDAKEHTWLAFFLLAAAIALGTWFYTPEQRAPSLTSGFGFSLLGVSIAIVYGYTALAKIDENWLAGHTILQISSVEREFAGLAAYAERLGIARERFWSLFATLVIPQELLVGVAYLLAVHQDRIASRALRVFCVVAFLLAVALHVGAEAMGLEIGWFSYYMLLAACCFLLPLSVVDRLVTVFTWPARFLLRQARAWESQSGRLASLLVFAGSGAVLLAVGYLIDLPGALVASAIAATALLGLALWQLWGPSRSDPRQGAVSAALAAAAMWAAIASSPVRWDFYRYLGGDLSRRGELQAAIDIYERGERYAPPGESRRDKIEELERRLGKIGK